MSADEFRNTEQAAIRLLAAREHSREELRLKLLRRHPSEVVEEVLEYLAREGLQSDDRYCELYVNQRTEKGYGPLRIKRELRERGISEQLADNYLDSYREQWHDLMSRLTRQKYGVSPATERKELARRGRFLEYRGFPPDLIRDYLFSAD